MCTLPQLGQSQIQTKDRDSHTKDTGHDNYSEAESSGKHQETSHIDSTGLYPLVDAVSSLSSFTSRGIQALTL